MAASNAEEGLMPSMNWFRAILLGILVVALGVPPAALRAHAQQEGPEKTAPPQSAPLPTPTQQTPTQAPKATPQAQSVITAQTNLVTLDVTVTNDKGDVLTGLKKQNFVVLDDDKPQQITNFAPSEAPITIVILMEFSRAASSWGFFGYKAKEWAAGFLSHLGDKDWVAFKTFDLKTTLQVDFTRNKNEVLQSISSLYFPDFSEANIFDALIETLDEMRDVQGKKSILLLTTGIDTFSKHTLDQTYKRLKETDVTIFCVGMGEEIDLYSRNGGGVTYLQAKNELTTFGQMTGGYAWFPRFYGEMPDIFNSVAALLRSQYTLGFAPLTGPDGKYHKLKIEVVDDAGNPLTFPDKKGHPKKPVIYARQGYSSPKPNPAD